MLSKIQTHRNQYNFHDIETLWWWWYLLSSSSSLSLPLSCCFLANIFHFHFTIKNCMRDKRFFHSWPILVSNISCDKNFIEYSLRARENLLNFNGFSLALIVTSNTTKENASRPVAAVTYTVNRWLPIRIRTINYQQSTPAAIYINAITWTFTGYSHHAC